MKKRLYRSSENRVFAGIIGGIGEYFDVDPVLLRVGWVAITVFSGIVPGVLVYLVALFIVPRSAQSKNNEEPVEEDSEKTV